MEILIVGGGIGGLTLALSIDVFGARGPDQDFRGKFERLEDVISQDELRAIFEPYQKVAGYHVDQVGRKTATR